MSYPLCGNLCGNPGDPSADIVMMNVLVVSSVVPKPRLPSTGTGHLVNTPQKGRGNHQGARGDWEPSHCLIWESRDDWRRRDYPLWAKEGHGEDRGDREGNPDWEPEHDQGLGKRQREIGKLKALRVEWDSKEEWDREDDSLRHCRYSSTSSFLR